MVQKEILETVKDERITVFVVWTPVLREDDRRAAVQAIANVTDERAHHFWDPDKSLGFAFGKAVTLPRGRELAWDVYFVFDSKSEWGDPTTTPANWMHQLGNDDRTLDGNKLRVTIEKLLGTAE